MEKVRETQDTVLGKNISCIKLINDIKDDLNGHFEGKGLLSLLDFVTGLIKLSDAQGYDEFSIGLKMQLKK